jgi:hypothetical protein
MPCTGSAGSQSERHGTSREATGGVNPSRFSGAGFVNPGGNMRGFAVASRHLSVGAVRAAWHRSVTWIDDVLADSFPASDPPSWAPGMARPAPMATSLVTAHRKLRLLLRNVSDAGARHAHFRGVPAPVPGMPTPGLELVRACPLNARFRPLRRSPVRPGSRAPAIERQSHQVCRDCRAAAGGPLRSIRR